MKPITLHPHELNRLLSTGSVTVWRPIDRIGRHGKATQFGPSNTPGYDWHFRCKRGLWQDYRNADLMKLAPLPPGSERWVRETWSYYCDYENLFDCIRYKTDGARRKPDFHRFANVSENTWYRFSMLCDGCGCKDHSWRSPVTMPRWASRLSVVSREVQARQVQSVTEEEAVEAGLADLTAFSEWWQRRFDTLGPDPWAWATTLERHEG